MCVIFVKNQNVAFPEESVMRNCWDNNPDMAGFMYTYEGKVHIKKGYMTFDAFKKALDASRAITGDNVPYVCHFRISTQGYDKSCCQPFPLSANMKMLKRRHVSTSIGVAHNGILSLTSDGGLDYSDTMKFITDFLVNIIRVYDWYKDDRTKLLIENLIEGSRFAILDKKGHCELMGKGWQEDEGVWYSNSTYSYNRKSLYTGWSWDSEDDMALGGAYSPYRWDRQVYRQHSKKEKSVPIEDGLYCFNEKNCPHTSFDDDSFCDSELCQNFHNCSYVKKCLEGTYSQDYNDFYGIDGIEDDDIYGIKARA